jgi:spore maturation protein CgeB
MRIFVAVRHSIDPSHSYGGLWSANFYPALRELGHDIVESTVDLLPLSRFMETADGFTREELELRAQVTQQIVDEVEAAHKEAPIQLFLTYFYNAHFDPAGFDEIRKLGILSVNFYCNSTYQFSLVAAIAARVDVSWHAERDAARLYRMAGATPIWVQMGADPQLYRPVSDAVRSPTACFVGQRYADRAHWAAAVVRADLPLDIYGAGWKLSPDGETTRGSAPAPTRYLGRSLHRPGSFSSYLNSLGKAVAEQGVAQGLRRTLHQWRYRRETRSMLGIVAPRVRGYLRSEEIVEAFARAAVCLNFSNVWADGRPGSALVPHVRLRDFEAPMCRSCYLTGHTDEIAQFYDIGKEIDTYDSEEELVEKLGFYLSHEGAAERMRTEGYRRARRDHTWRRRFEQLFQALPITTAKQASSR